MSVITGGLVAYEDGVKANEEYAPAKKARVELRFDIPEGGDAQGGLDRTMTMAQSMVLKILGSKRASGTVASVATLAAPLADGGGPAPAVAPVGKTKEDLAREAGLEVKPAKVTKAPGRPKKDVEAKDPDEIDTPAEAASKDEWEVNDKPEPISDADILGHIGKKNATLGDPQQIRDLIATYNPTAGQPFAARQIAQERRQNFLDKLAALKPIPKAATK